MHSSNNYSKIYLYIIGCQDSSMIELLVDGKKVPMNNYVQNVFFKVIEALVSTLKGVDGEWKKIEIKLEK